MTRPASVLAARWSGALALLAAASATLTPACLCRIENVFDERYEQAANYPSPGRTILVGATAHVR